MCVCALCLYTSTTALASLANTHVQTCVYTFLSSIFRCNAHILGAFIDVEYVVQSYAKGQFRMYACMKLSCMHTHLTILKCKYASRLKACDACAHSTCVGPTHADALGACVMDQA